MAHFLRQILVLAAAAAVTLALNAAPGPGRMQDDDAGIAIHQVDVLVFPFAMMTSGILAGEARVVISVDAAGKLNDALVIGYTHEAFAEAALGALRRWTFEPARARGQPRASRADVLFTFRSDIGAMVQSLPGMTDANRLRLAGDRYVYRAYQLRDLDHIPIPAQVVPPAKAGLGGAKRTVTVEFYIDPEGRVRVPAIGRDEPDDAYAAAAVSAVEQWRFEPPLRHGHPVLVLARQDFTFVPKP